MDIVNSVASDVTDTFKGIFSGGSDFVGGMTKGKKIALGVVAAVVVILLIWLVWKWMNKGSFGPRRVGAAGCCGKLQASRLMVAENQISDGDMIRNERDYAEAGMPKISTQYGPFVNNFDNMSYPAVQGFSSPAAKPTANQDSPMAENWNGNQALVRQQVPYSRNMKPSYEEADFVNMAYN